MENTASKQKSSDNFDDLPSTGFVRQSQLIPKVLPFSAPTLRRLVQNKQFPSPIYIAPRCRAWRVGDVREWLNNLQEAAA